MIIKAELLKLTLGTKIWQISNLLKKVYPCTVSKNPKTGIKYLFGTGVSSSIDALSSGENFFRTEIEARTELIYRLEKKIEEQRAKIEGLGK